MSRYRELKNNNAIMARVALALAVAVFMLAVALAYERGHNGGYNDGWNDGRADGVEQGWSACIEENNLYERYYYYGQ